MCFRNIINRSKNKGVLSELRRWICVPSKTELSVKHNYKDGIRQTAAGERGGGMTNSVDTGAPCRLETTNSGSWICAYRGNTPVQNDENNNRNHITYGNRALLSLSLSLRSELEIITSFRIVSLKIHLI